jgi:hypothetical protein
MDSSSTTSDPNSAVAYYVSIFSGVCLAISEALPYLSKVKGNGIIQVALNYFRGFEEEKKKEAQEQQAQQQALFQSILSRLDTLIELQRQKFPS